MKKNGILKTLFIRFMGLSIIMIFLMGVASYGEANDKWFDPPGMSEYYQHMLKYYKEQYSTSPEKLNQFMNPKRRVSVQYAVGETKTWRLELDGIYSSSATCNDGFNCNNETEKETTLIAAGNHSNVWMEVDANGNPVSPGGVTAEKVKEIFENTVHPKDTEYFGNEPDVDGDNRVQIVFVDMDGAGNSLGYFWGFNEHTVDPNTYYQRSNEADVIFVDASESENDVKEILAHEFQHMIHWNMDADHDEKPWLDEGLSQYAIIACGFQNIALQAGGVLRGHIDGFSDEPNNSLIDWHDMNQPGLLMGDYGQSFLFINYLAERAEKNGNTISTVTKALVDEEKDGKEAIDEIAKKYLKSDENSFKELFGKWIIANRFPNDSNYGYKLQNLNFSMTNKVEHDLIFGTPYKNGLTDKDKITTPAQNSVVPWGSQYWSFTVDNAGPDLLFFINGSGGWGVGYDPVYKLGLVGSFDVYESNGNWFTNNWSKQINNSNYTQAVVIISATDSGGDYGIKVDPSEAKPNILAPTESAPDFVGKPDDPSKTSIEVEVKTASGTFITGLTKDDFEVIIGGSSSDIVTSVELADKYVLNVQPPNQSAEGLYDLVVTVFGESDTETNAIQYAITVASNVDVVLVIDRSGSMSNGFYESGVYYLRDAKNAANLFVDLMNLGDMVGVVSFSSSSSVNYGLTEIIGTDIQTAAKAAIDSLSAGGGTNIGNGLTSGQNELDNNGSSIHPWSMILLSDGYGSLGNALDDIKPKKTKVNTIALGSHADEALLQDIASQTGGEYYFAPFADDLADIYSSLSGQVAGHQTLFSETGSVQQGATDEKTVNVDPSVEEAIFFISWSGSGNDLDLTLEDPNGNVIDSTTSDPNITFTSGSNSESFTVTDPTSGTWIMRVYGGTITSTALNIPLNVLRNKENWTLTGYDDTAPDMKLLGTMYSTLNSGLDYSATVIADTPLTLSTYLDKTGYVQGDPILITVAIADLQPITGASVVAQVTTPSSSGSFSLYDDGMHGDAATNDGIYGNAYTQTNETGTYSFEIEATGTSTSGDSFSRVGYTSTVVSDANDADGDNMPDTWESNVGLDPTVDDSGNDPDADGLTNLQEYQNGTDPFSSDTDADDLTDGDEVNIYGTDPTKWDTDTGGESDGSEVANGRDPLNPDDDVVGLQAEIQLNSDWNLISLSLQPENTSIDNVLNPISGKYSSAWAFINNAWNVYDPANPGSGGLTTMETGWGYWLNMNESATLTIAGSTPSNSIQLGSGWNLVGYNSATAQPVADALASIDGKYVLMWAFINGSWRAYDPAYPGFSDLTTMELGYGYWINTTEACTWTLP